MFELRVLQSRAAFTLDVELQFPSRGVTALFGPSGCGKTSLLRCLLGLDRVPGARVLFDGQAWQEDDYFLPVHQRRAALVFQEANLFSHLDVRGNLEYGLRRARSRQQRLTLARAVELLGIGDLLARRVQGLSGGERQRVAIARALAMGPRALLMDEPLAALDTARRGELLGYFDTLHRELEMPLVYISHALDEVTRIADHLLLMQAGRVIANGAMQEVLQRPQLPLPLGDEAGVVLGARVALRDTQWQLARLDFAGGSLWTRDQGHETGSAVRVRILARDVSLALGALPDTSIGNQLPCVIDTIVDDPHPANVMVRVRLGESALLARLTRRSADRLGLHPGMALWAQVKTVALSA